MNKKQVLSLLKQEMVPALGVTEPSAIALAAARAAEEIKGELIKVELTLDPGVYKNAYSCAIPNTNEKGIEMAALLGAIKGDPNLGLKVMQNVSDEDVKRARELKEKDIIKVDIKEGHHDLFVSCKIETKSTESLVIIKDRHDNIQYVEVNGNIVLDKKEEKQPKEDEEIFANFNISEVLEFIEKLSDSDIKFTLDAVQMNKTLAQAGKEGPGLGLGKGLTQLVAEDTISDDISNYAQRLTAFAVDARMGGIPKPAMSFCGSGDHGIIATLPLTAVTERKRIPKEKLARSIILSFIITYYLKNRTGKLSAYCGCAVAAGTGAAAGSAYLLGGNKKQIIGAINNMAGNITGLICDGGNYGCALKAATAASTAVESALLAVNDFYLKANNGIVGNNLNETLDNMGKIAVPGMEKTNDVIINILQKRS